MNLDLNRIKCFERAMVQTAMEHTIAKRLSSGGEEIDSGEDMNEIADSQLKFILSFARAARPMHLQRYQGEYVEMRNAASCLTTMHNSPPSMRGPASAFK